MADQISKPDAPRGGRVDTRIQHSGNLKHVIESQQFTVPLLMDLFERSRGMQRLGGRVLSTEHARAFSSEIEGENVEDTIHIVGSFSDVIVIRHNQEGGAKRA